MVWQAAYSHAAVADELGNDPKQYDSRASASNTDANYMVFLFHTCISNETVPFYNEAW